MQFKQETIVVNDVQIYLLHFEPFDSSIYLDFLTDIEQEKYFEFRREDRRQEYVATRILKYNLFGFKQINYNELGAPFIDGEGFISISHTKGTVGIASSKSHSVGLDLELIANRAQVIIEKFLSVNEQETLNLSSEMDMTIAWSIKETLYKLAERKSINFVNELAIKKIKQDHWLGIIKNPNEQIHVDLRIFVRNNLLVTVNSLPVQRETRNLY